MKEAKNEMCCSQFDPKPWDGKTFEWNKRLFVKDKVFTFMYMPINFGKVIAKLNQKVESAGASIPDFMCLSDHTSLWNMDLYLAVDKKVEGLNNVELSGKFMSKVYEGDFKQTGKWMQDFAKYLSDQNIKAKKYYMWYTTCPKCAKVYGKNYVVILAEVA